MPAAPLTLDARSPRLRRTLERRLAGEGKLLLTFLTAGFPTRAASVAILKALAADGAVDILEIGVPFSDPLADGPTIQGASQRALEGGMTLSGVLEVAAEVRAEVPEVPIILMGYLNPFLAMGTDELVRRAGEAGVDGFIIPDLLPDEEPALEASLRDGGLDRIQLLAPTTAAERIAWIDVRATAFLYLVAVTGVTGARRTLPEGLAGFARAVRRRARHPFIVGFGISSAESASGAAAESDGVVVGSALIDRVREATEAGADPVEAARAFVRELRAGLER